MYPAPNTASPTTAYVTQGFTLPLSSVKRLIEWSSSLSGCQPAAPGQARGWTKPDVSQVSYQSGLNHPNSARQEGQDKTSKRRKVEASKQRRARRSVNRPNAWPGGTRRWHHGAPSQDLRLRSDRPTRLSHFDFSTFRLFDVSAWATGCIPSACGRACGRRC